jgi:succinate dehydrogenase / fumarate reductase cytochrome b subunit
MAITGLLMVLFVIGHLLGNLTIYKPGGINAYAEGLHKLVPVVWGNRIVMGLAVVLHVILAIQLTLENNAAKPVKYAVARSLRATFFSKNMIWTGLAIGAFIAYHLVHFTFQVLGVNAHDLGVHGMVVAGLRGAGGAIYVVAVLALFAHLVHGIQSLFQTSGLSNAIMLPRYGIVGKLLSAVFLVGFGSIPVVILLGILN